MKRFVEIVLHENVLAVLLSLIAFGVYCTTLCHGVGITDAGELATVLCTLGIAHPTGYPLFTLIGHVWMLLPLGGEEIIRLNYFAALLTAIAVGLFFKTTLEISRSTVIFPEKKKRKNEHPKTSSVFAAAAGSLVLAFSTTFWSQSTSIEVYALHLVLLLLAVLFFVRGLEEQCALQNILARDFIFFAFVLGLCFCNHMTTILLAPAFLWLYFMTFKMKKQSFIRLLYLMPFFLLGLSVYLYFPIRAASHPLLDWGHPATLERIFWHVSGKQFRVWMFSGWDVVQQQFTYLVSHFTDEFHPIIVLVIVIGFVAAFLRSRQRFWFFVLLTLTDTVYAVNYSIFDIDSYFLLLYITCGWLVVFGIVFIFPKINDGSSWKKGIFAAAMLSLVALQFISNYKNANEPVNKLPDEFIQNSFSEFAPHAIVFSGAWDYFISPSWYGQFVKGRRRDVAVIDKSLLQNRSWYFIQLEKTAPGVLQRSRESVDAFLAELAKFEHEQPFDGAVIQARWSALLADLVEKSLPDRPVYVDARIMNEFPATYRRVPSGLFFRLVNNTDTSVGSFPVYHFSNIDQRNPVGKDFVQYYAMVLGYEAEWCMRNGNKKLEIESLQELVRLNPQNYYARQSLANLTNN